MALVTSVLRAGDNNHETTSEEANAVYTDFASEGVVGAVANTAGVAPATGGFAVNAQGTPDMTVAVSSGVAYVQGTPTSQNSQTFRIKNSASANVTISANSSGSTKYDWVYVKLDATKLNTPNTAGDDVATLTTSRSSTAASDDGTPPTYGYPIAIVTVANGASSITNGNISDARVQTGMQPIASAVATTSWASLGATPNSVTANGNRSYDLVFNSTDLTGDVSPGMRLKLTRTVTAPTQCADLEASSSQYFSKSSPSGMTFTDDFTCMAWVKLESYTAGTIISRYNGTNGWLFSVLVTGQLRVIGLGASNREFSSYQSIPLNKWVHVVATLDMSGAAATFYIDGVLVPGVSTGSTGTSLTQAGNLEVGAHNGGTNPFDGKIAQAAVFSSVLSASTIRSYVSQTLSGSETSIAAGYTLSNSLLDLSANDNDLTANGSAVATNTDTPFTQTQTGITAGTTNYGIITAASFSTNTTLTVQVPEGDTIPTSGGVSAVSYSTQATPYGFPGISDVLGYTQLLTTFATSASSQTQILGLTVTVTIPQGKQIEVVIGALGTSDSGSFTPVLGIWDGTVGSGTQVAQGNYEQGFSGAVYLSTGVLYPSAGSKTFNAGFHSAGGGTATIHGSTAQPVFLIVRTV